MRRSVTLGFFVLLLFFPAAHARNLYEKQTPLLFTAGPSPIKSTPLVHAFSSYSDPVVFTSGTARLVGGVDTSRFPELTRGKLESTANGGYRDARLSAKIFRENFLPYLTNTVNDELS